MDEKLCRYSRPHKEVITRRKSSEYVGFTDGLYTTGGAPGTENELEDKFFKKVDQLSSDAIDQMIAHPGVALPSRLRSAFSTFLMSMMNRTPDRIADLKVRLETEVDKLIVDMQARYDGGERFELPKGHTFEETLLEIRKRAIREEWGKLLRRTVTSQSVGTLLNNMEWFTRTLDPASITFLTSDKPVVHSNGLETKQGNLAVPLGPRLLFVATINQAVAKNILDVPDSFLVRRVNHELVCQAREYVYGFDDTQLHFVERRLRNNRPPPRPVPPPNYRWPIE